MSSLTRIGRYEIIRPLGRGAMGVVYLARDPNIEREIALKTVRFDIESQSFKLEEAKARFLKEAKISGRLQHPHIVTIFDVGEDGGILYLAMEYVAGGSFSQRIVEPNLLPVEDRIRVVAEVAEALGHAHERGVIHRDVKPANILLTEALSAKVTDFGIGKFLTGDTDLTSTGQMVGSPAYMSPEQIKGEKLDVRSDIFSLGIVLYQSLTGRKPFPAETLTTLVYQILHEEPPDPIELNPDLPAPLVGILGRCLAKKREERYTDAGELAAELSELLGFAPVTTTSGLSDSKVRRPRRLMASGTGPRPVFVNGSGEARQDAGFVVTRTGPSATDASRTEIVPAAPAAPQASLETESAPTAEPSAPEAPPAPVEPPRGKSRLPLVAVTLVVLGVAGALGSWKLGLLGGEAAPSPTPVVTQPAPVQSPVPTAAPSPSPEVTGTPASAGDPTPAAVEPTPVPGAAAPVAGEPTKKPKAKTSPTPAPTATPVPPTPTPKPFASYNVKPAGFVRLDVNVPQARVFMDGRFIGIADDWDDKGGGSRLIFYEQEGTHRLRFAYPGYRDLVIDLVLNPTAPAAVDVQQKLEKGSPDGPTGPEGKIDAPDRKTVRRLKIVADPPDARITLDGAEIAAGERDLEPGNRVCEIVATAPGHREQRYRVLVSGAAAEPQAELKIKLKKL